MNGFCPHCGWHRWIQLYRCLVYRILGNCIKCGNKLPAAFGDDNPADCNGKLKPWGKEILEKARDMERF